MVYSGVKVILEVFENFLNKYELKKITHFAFFER